MRSLPLKHLTSEGNPKLIYFVTKKLNSNDKIQKKMISIEESCILITVALFWYSLCFIFLSQRELSHILVAQMHG